MQPKYTFSAIILNYNHSQYIATALGNLMAQTRPFDEILIVDDCSTDNSVEIIKELIKDVPHARLIQNPQNQGVNKTVNFIIQEAKGDYVFTAAADDSYSTRAVEYAEKLLERWPGAGMVASNARTHNISTGEERSFTLPLPQEERFYSAEEMSALARSRSITFYGGGNMLRRDTLIEIGIYLAELQWHSDWLVYFLLACRQGFIYCPQEIVRIRIASDQYSQGCFDWKRQKPVIEAFVTALQTRYPQELPFFRNNALLPTYDVQSLFLLLSKPNLRSYLTPLLAWRLLTYKPMRALARALLPKSLWNGIRKVVRV